MSRGSGNPEKDFLRAELDRIGPRTPICAATFSVALLPSNSPFFEAAYADRT